MKIIESFSTKNPCYKTNQNPAGDSRYINFQKNGPKGLMLHSVGCGQPKATVFTNSQNSPTQNNVCVHAYIDGNTGEVYQCMPWNYRGWHGGGSSNNTHIGVEMCEGYIKYTGGDKFTVTDSAKAKAVADRTYKAAVELFAYLCDKYNLNPLGDGVIISHNEGYKRGIASGHTDCEHWWKGLGLSYTMNGFRDDVKKAMSGAIEPIIPAPTPSTPSSSETIYRVRLTWEDSNSQIGAWKNLGSAKKQVNENPKYKAFDPNGKVVYSVSSNAFEPYKIKVTANVLNYRSGPSTSYAVKGTIKKGEVYTIVEEKDGWGKLKSGAGWICLDYTQKI